MGEYVITCRINAKPEAGAKVVFSFQEPRSPRNDDVSTAGRLARAVRWAVDLDAHYGDLVRAGKIPCIDIPSENEPFSGRVQKQAVADYQELRLRVGSLIRPLLLSPPTLNYLYPFQQRGVEWLLERAGAILADDMGLGKTVQVISAVRILFNRGAMRDTMVLCPRSLIATWEREFSRWAPELGVAVVTPPARIREEAWRTVLGRRHVILTNYEQLRKPPVALRRTPPDLIVADEAHRLRNRTSLVASGSLRLRAHRFWALTGTPVERDLEDLATLLSVVAPTRFAPADAKAHPSVLRSKARGYVLRRRKMDVLDELPPVRDTTEVVELTDVQETAYRRAIKEHRQQRGIGDELALVTRLQMLCDIEPVSGRSSKVDRVLDALERIRDQGEKAVVFSYRLEPLRALRGRIGRRWGPEASALLVGDMSSAEREGTVAQFRENGQTFVLLASNRVGGEGLTLTEANHVFLFNQWWNPSANDQARDRVVRIGQQRAVRVYRYCCRATIEEALERVLASKRILVDNAVERLALGDRGAWRRVIREIGIEELIEAG